MEERLVDLGPTRGNTRLNVAFAGPPDGEPILLLHGFPETWWSWRRQIEPLANLGFRLVLPDLRGSGKSDTHGPYELAELASDVDALLDVESIRRPLRIVGHDWGGATAWTLVRRNPGVASKLAILNSCLPERQIEALSTRFDPVQFSRSWYVLLFQVPFLVETLLARNQGAFVKTIIRSGMKDADAMTDAELEPFCIPATRKGGAAGMVGPYRAVFRRALWDLVWKHDPFPDRGPVHCPTLLVWGEADPTQDLRLIENMTEIVPNLTTVRLPRSGHFPQSEAPDAVNDVLLPFLEGA